MDIQKTSNAKEQVKQMLFQQGIGDFGIGVQQDGVEYVVTVYLYDKYIRPKLPPSVDDIRIKIIQSPSPCFACD